MIWILFVALVVLQIFDVVTTRLALAGAKNREANKIVALLMSKIGVMPALVLLKAMLISGFLAAVLLAPSIDLIVALVVIDALYVCVVINNFRLLRRG